MKTMERKFFGVLLVFISITILFISVSCKKSGDTIPKDAPITLTYWHPQQQAVESYNDFAKIATEIFAKLGYPNVTMISEAQEGYGYDIKLVSAFASGNGPDMFLAKASEYALEGGVNPVALPLPDDVVKPWLAAIAPIHRTQGLVNGKYYGFQLEGDVVMFMYINGDHFREIGLDPDRDYPKTWEEFRALAKRLTKYDASGRIVRSGWVPRTGAAAADKFSPFIHGFGGQYLSSDFTKVDGYLNSPESLRSFQYLHDLIYVDKIVNLEFGHPDTAFQSGLCSMTCREAFFAGQTMEFNPNLDLRIYPVPHGEKDLITLGGGSWHGLINSKSKYTDLLLKMYKELPTVENDMRMHEKNLIAPVLAATLSLDNPYFKTLPYAKVMMDVYLSSKPLAPSYYNFTKYDSILAPIISDGIDEIIQGADVKSTIDRYTRRVQTLLDE